MSYRFSDIVLLRFPFTNGVGFKQRPAVVLADTQDGDLLVARITSRIRSGPHEVTIHDWQAAGLLRPSQIRIHKLASLDAALVLRRMGTMGVGDAGQLRLTIRQFWTNL